MSVISYCDVTRSQHFLSAVIFLDRLVKTSKMLDFEGIQLYIGDNSYTVGITMDFSWIVYRFTGICVSSYRNSQ